MGNKAIRDDGGYFDYYDYWDRRITWIAYSNDPRPYWNEWAVYIEVGNIVHGPFEQWWYGEWW